MPNKPHGHAKDHSLSPEGLRILREKGPAPGDGFDAALVALTAELGLREGEAGHAQASWLSFAEGKLRIPEKMLCNIGPKGKPCARCLNKRGGIWRPKTPDAARTVPYKLLPGVAEVLHPFFARHSKVGLTETSVWRRVKAMMKRAGLSPATTPHALRATAAQKWAELGLGKYELMAVMGWRDPHVAEVYIKASGRGVEAGIARALREGIGQEWLS